MTKSATNAIIIFLLINSGIAFLMFGSIEKALIYALISIIGIIFLKKMGVKYTPKH